MVNLQKVKTGSALLGIEMKKVWSRPILELSVILIALMSVSAIQTLNIIIIPSEAQSIFQSMVNNGVSNIMDLQMLPLIIVCSILISLSFARDYEQGLMQSLLSSPISRAKLYTIKLVAVLLPLTFLSWGFVFLFSALNYYSDFFVVIQSNLFVLPITFLSLMFYGGIATFVSLVIKRTIPSALTAMLAGFFFWFITTLNTDSIGSIADYLVLTPYKAPLVLLGRINGLSYPVGTIENSLPLWNLAFLVFFYAVIFVFPTFLYFTRRFEVRE